MEFPPHLIIANKVFFPTILERFIMAPIITCLVRHLHDYDTLLLIRFRMYPNFSNNYRPSAPGLLPWSTLSESHFHLFSAYTYIIIDVRRWLAERWWGNFGDNFAIYSPVDVVQSNKHRRCRSSMHVRGVWRIMNHTLPVWRKTRFYCEPLLFGTGLLSVCVWLGGGCDDLCTPILTFGRR